MTDELEPISDAKARLALFAPEMPTSGYALWRFDSNISMRERVLMDAQLEADRAKIPEIRAEERKKIGEWLDNCDGIEIPKDTVVKLPALSGSTEYRAIPHEKLEALKSGKEMK
jgi:hypothetical protein